MQIQAEICPNLLGYMSLTDTTPQRQTAAISGIKWSHFVCLTFTAKSRKLEQYGHGPREGWKQEGLAKGSRNLR
jgi:hypothetical protein